MFTYDDPTVLVNEVSKIYRADNKRSLVGHLRGRSDKGAKVQALKNVSFVAERGECIGVLGRNGSGKSTLMRLIAGNEAPTHGELLVSGSPTLLNVSAALQPRLSGNENIRLGLLAQGVSPAMIPDLSKEICEFADIGDAVYRPMATYSSGMGARLKFAISTAVTREILLIDEALATGDAAFTRRAQDRMAGFLGDAGTIFLVSHAVSTIKAICTRAIWLHEGNVIADGNVEVVTHLYNKWTARVAMQKTDWAADLLDEIQQSYQPQKIHKLSSVERLLNRPKGDRGGA